MSAAMTVNEHNEFLDDCDADINVVPADGRPSHFYLSVQIPFSRELGSTDELRVLRDFQRKLDEQAKSENIGEVTNSQVEDGFVIVNLYLYNIDANEDESAPATNALKVLYEYLRPDLPCRDAQWIMAFGQSIFPDGVVTSNAVLCIADGGIQNA